MGVFSNLNFFLWAQNAYLAIKICNSCMYKAFQCNQLTEFYIMNLSETAYSERQVAQNSLFDFAESHTDMQYPPRAKYNHSPGLFGTICFLVNAIFMSETRLLVPVRDTVGQVDFLSLSLRRLIATLVSAVHPNQNSVIKKQFWLIFLDSRQTSYRQLDRPYYC